MQCFVDNPDSDQEQTDILILGTTDRNRALNGDIVILRLKPRDDWFIHESYIPKNGINSSERFFI